MKLLQPRLVLAVTRRATKSSPIRTMPSGGPKTRRTIGRKRKPSPVGCGWRRMGEGGHGMAWRRSVEGWSWWAQAHPTRASLLELARGYLRQYRETV